MHLKYFATFVSSILRRVFNPPSIFPYFYDILFILRHAFDPVYVIFTTGEPTAAEGPDDGDPAVAGGADRLQVTRGRGQPVDEGAPPEGRRPRQVLAGQYPANGTRIVLV